MFINLGNNETLLIGNLPMNDKLFFQIWMKQFESRLREVYDEYLSEINENGMPYVEYCKYIYDYQPILVEEDPSVVVLDVQDNESILFTISHNNC